MALGNTALHAPSLLSGTHPLWEGSDRSPLHTEVCIGLRHGSMALPKPCVGRRFPEGALCATQRQTLILMQGPTKTVRRDTFFVKPLF